MALVRLIRQFANEMAAAGNWESVAEVLNAQSVEKTLQGRLVTMGATLEKLTVQEREPTLAAFGASSVGKAGLQKLATIGLDYSHPITVGLIESLRDVLPEGVADKLLRLGRWYVSPAMDIGLQSVTAAQCRDAWQAEQLEARITNATALANERLQITQTAEEQYAVWASAWLEAV